MLLTTNIVTCIFACWTRKNASSLTNKAFSLAMSVRDKSKISTETVALDQSMRKRDSRDSISGMNILQQQQQQQRQQLSVPIPIPRNQRNNTYHHGNNVSYGVDNIKRSPFNMALCSPIPSNYSKSYSYAPPIVNMQSVAPNQRYVISILSAFCMSAHDF